jgi:putative transposase
MCWHAHYHTSGTGHLYQDVSFPIAAADHFLNVVRYVERNALRANLVERAEDWRFGSLWRRLHPNAQPALALDPWPVPQPAHWTRLVNQPLSEAELKAIRIRDLGPRIVIRVSARVPAFQLQ